MKLNKTAAALVLAGVAAAPMAQAEVTLSGSIGINLGSSDADGAELTFSGDDSTLNLAASHEMSNGLTGYGNYRLDGALTGSTPATDNLWLGMKGDFGDIRIGEVPDASEYGQVAGDIMEDIGGENAGLSYTGSFGSATVGVNWSPEGNTDRFGAGAKFTAGGFGIGLGFGGVGDDSVISAGASFGLGGASVAVAYKDFDNDKATIGAKASWAVNGISLGLTYEGDIGDADDDNKIRLDAGYDLGGGMSISTRVNIYSGDGASSTDDAGVVTTDDDLTDYRIQLAKSF